MFVLCLLSAALTLICLYVAWRARRGERIGSEPHCARCDFNLTGRPPNTGRCPECGANLSAPRATEFGTLEPSWPGIAFALLFAAAFLAGTYAAGRQADWQTPRVQLWPSSWLTAELDRGNAEYPVAAELVRRIQSDSLTGVGRERALAALCRITAWPRRSVRAGDELPFDEAAMAVRSVPGNTSEQASPTYQVHRRLARYRFGDGPWLETHWSWMPIGMIGIGRHTIWLDVPVDQQPARATAVESVYEFRLVKREDEQMFYATNQHGSLAHRAADLSVVAWEQRIRAPVQITAAGAEDDVPLILDETLRNVVRNSIAFDELDRMGFRRPADPPPARGLEIRRYLDEGRRPFVELRLIVNAPPMDVAFDVYLRHPTTGAEYLVGAFAVGKGRRVQLGSSGGGLTGEAGAALLDWPDRATVILRPSKEKARNSPSVTAIWGEPIVFDDVTIWREWIERRDQIERGRTATTTAPTTQGR